MDIQLPHILGHCLGGTLSSYLTLRYTQVREHWRNFRAQPLGIRGRCKRVWACAHMWKTMFLPVVGPVPGQISQLAALPGESPFWPGLLVSSSAWLGFPVNKLHLPLSMFYSPGQAVSSKPCPMAEHNPQSYYTGKHGHIFLAALEHILQPAKAGKKIRNTQILSLASSATWPRD